MLFLHHPKLLPHRGLVWYLGDEYGSLEMKYTDLDYAVTAVTAEQGSNTNIRYSQGDVPKIGHTRDS
jgi:hypothetical protein